MQYLQKILTFIEKNAFLKWLSYILLVIVAIFTILPFVYVPIMFVGLEIYSVMESENFTVLTTSTAIILSLSAILFSASRSALASYEKVLFYEMAKKCLFSGLLLIIALLITYIMKKYNLHCIIANVKNLADATFIENLVMMFISIGAVLVLIALKHIIIVIYTLINNIRPDFPSSTYYDDKERQRIKKYIKNKK